MNVNQTNANQVPASLKDYLLIDTCSKQQAHDVAASSFVPHKITPLRESSNFHFVHSQASLTSISACYTSYGSNVTIQPELFEHFYLIQMPTSGTVWVESNGKQCAVSNSQGSIVSPTKRTQFTWSDDAGLVTIKVDRKAVERQLIMLNQSDLNSSVEFDLRMNFSGLGGYQWKMEIVRLLQYFEYQKNSELVNLEPYFEQRLIEILLLTQPNNLSGELNQACFNAPTSSVVRAIDYMHVNFDQKITLGDLAQVTGVTTRTLHNGFRRYRDVSPMNYLLEIRLAKARADLQNSKLTRSITSIAQASGFSHLGRFSQIYFQYFGERPSQTLTHR